MKMYVKIHPADLVGVALAPLSAGTVVRTGQQDVTLLQDIPQGHKFALVPIPAGSPVIKYGASIGTACSDIPAGAWVHVHNLQTGLGEILDYTYEPSSAPLPPTDDLLFQGFRRCDGKVGVRNEIWIIPTVGCVNSVAAAIARQSQHLLSGSIDGIYAFSHPYGCSQMGEDQENTRKILAGLINHPNAGGVLVVGLGCENSGIGMLKPYIGRQNEDRVKFLACQDVEDEVSSGVARVKELVEYAAPLRREPVGCDDLVIGLKCGGSDGLSGITANPTVGVFSDLLISKGGTTILTEVPEMFGAETQLMNRCENERIFSEAVDLINSFKSYFLSCNQTIYENPSPGNKQGGISTLEDKSLGCTQKSGSAPVSGVLPYGGRVSRRGLHLLSGPGNDMVASTALAAAGAHIVLFTTGRGTPFAAPVPTVKISSSSALAAKKPRWIDFDCGTLVEQSTAEELGQRLFDYVLEVASGRKVKAEEAGFRDMAIFKQGVTL